MRPQTERRLPPRHLGETTHQHVVDDRRSVDQIERLEDETDPGSNITKLGRRGALDFATVDTDGALGDRYQAVDGPQQRRFSRPRQPDDDHELAFPDRQVDVVEGAQTPGVDDREALDFDHRAEDRAGPPPEGGPVNYDS